MSSLTNTFLTKMKDALFLTLMPKSLAWAKSPPKELFLSQNQDQSKKGKKKERYSFFNSPLRKNERIIIFFKILKFILYGQFLVNFLFLLCQNKLNCTHCFLRILLFPCLHQYFQFAQWLSSSVLFIYSAGYLKYNIDSIGFPWWLRP